MAIFHVSVRTIARSRGQTAVDAAAFRAGLSLHDRRKRKRYDYRELQGVEETKFLVPSLAPSWAIDPEALWNEAEAAERRCDSTVARDFEIALPHELSPAQRSNLAFDIAQKLVDRYGFALQVSIHRSHGTEGNSLLNHHAHLLASTRRLDQSGFTEKTREWDSKRTGPHETRWFRTVAADTINEHLRLAGINAQVSAKSLAEQAREAKAKGLIHEAEALSRLPQRRRGNCALH